MSRFSEPRSVVAVLLAVAALCFAPPMSWPSTNDDQWNNVATLTRRATYIFIDRNHTCFDGMIKQVGDRAVTITRLNAPEITVERTSLLRITSGAWAGGVLFSGRSSWSDVVRIVGRHFHPNVALVMKSRQEYKGKLLSASDATLILKSSGKKVNVGKDDVSTISYVQPKPLSSSAAYADDELAWMKVFDPQLWPRLMRLQSSMSIRLYDASSPQDDSSIICKPEGDVTQAVF